MYSSFPTNAGALNTTVLNHGSILGSYDAYITSVVLDMKCQTMTGDPKLFISNDGNRVYTVQYFNSSGLFHKFLMRFVTEEGENKWVHKLRMQSVTEEGENKWVEMYDMYAVFLGAYSMQSGITIEKEDLELLRIPLKRLKMHPDAKGQMEKALDNYKSDGKIWDFESNEPRSPPASESSAPILSGVEGVPLP